MNLITFCFVSLKAWRFIDTQDDEDLLNLVITMMEAAKIGRDLRLADATSVDRNRKPLMKNLCLLDCEQSLFFFRFSKGDARAGER